MALTRPGTSTPQAEGADMQESTLVSRFLTARSFIPRKELAVTLSGGEEDAEQ